MNLKILLKKINRSNFGIFIRNWINYKPVDLDTDFLKSKSSISDAFCWRTDNGYETIIKFSNLVKMFYNKNSSIKIIFCSKNNSIIKEKIINNTDLSNEILVNEEFMGGKKDYGSFYIFHDLENVEDETIISNRCYVGYSLKKKLPSFVHGNTLTKYETKSDTKNDIVKSTFFSKKKYIVQNLYSDESKVEIYIANPTAKKINIMFENKNYQMRSYQCRILKTQSDKISLKSNCMFLRPIVFEEKKDYLNVHHG